MVVAEGLVVEEEEEEVVDGVKPMRWWVMVFDVDVDVVVFPLSSPFSSWYWCEVLIVKKRTSLKIDIFRFCLVWPLLFG